MKCVKIFVEGRVQGVFFRVYTRKFAQSLSDVTGYVRNLPNGQVEIFAEGSHESLKKLTEWAKNEGSPGSYVVRTDEKWIDIDKRKYSGFQITY